MTNKVIQFIKSKKSLIFIVVNIFAAFLGFVRSFAFMKFLDLTGLGLITLIQTGIMLIGFFQFGLINGGYRIVAIQNQESSSETNDTIFSYFGFLSIILIVVTSLLLLLNIFTEPKFVYITLFAGILTLINNWVTNNLIAKQNLKVANIGKFVAAIVSTLCLPLAFYFGVIGGAITILIQPLMLIFVSFLFDRSLLPIQWKLKIIGIKKILHYGFIPYLSGMFFLLYIQAERWSVGTFLGTEELGKLFLVFLTSNLWVLIPTSILSLFFPRAVKCYENKEINEFWLIVRKHFYILIGFNLLGIIFIWQFLDVFVNLVFPKYNPYLIFVYFALPGMFLKTLADPISLVLNSVVKLKPIFWSDVVSLIFYTLLIIALLLFQKFSLLGIIVCMDIYFLVKFVFLVTSLIFIRHELIH